MIPFIGAKPGRILSAVGAAFLVVVTAFLRGRSVGVQKQKEQAHADDSQRAEQLRRLVKAARSVDDDRSAVEQLRDAGRLRD